MLKEKKNADSMDVLRLGKVFESENLDQLRQHAEDYGLPAVPYNATVDELNRLLEYLACEMPYIQSAVGELRVDMRKASRKYKRAYAQAYISAERTMAGATVSILKMVAENNQNVLQAEDEIDKVKNRLEIIQSRLMALQIIDTDVRKLLSVEVAAMQRI